MMNSVISAAPKLSPLAAARRRSGWSITSSTSSPLCSFVLILSMTPSISLCILSRAWSDLPAGHFNVFESFVLGPAAGCGNGARGGALEAISGGPRIGRVCCIPGLPGLLPPTGDGAVGAGPLAEPGVKSSLNPSMNAKLPSLESLLRSRPYCANVSLMFQNTRWFDIHTILLASAFQKSQRLRKLTRTTFLERFLVPAAFTALRPSRSSEESPVSVSYSVSHISRSTSQLLVAPKTDVHSVRDPAG